MVGGAGSPSQSPSVTALPKGEPWNGAPPAITGIQNRFAISKGKAFGVRTLTQKRNRAGQGNDEYYRTGHGLFARTAGRTAKGKNDKHCTGHGLAVGPADPSGTQWCNEYRPAGARIICPHCGSSGEGQKRYPPHRARICCPPCGLEFAGSVHHSRKGAQRCGFTPKNPLAQGADGPAPLPSPPDRLPAR